METSQNARGGRKWRLGAGLAATALLLSGCVSVDGGGGSGGNGSGGGGVDSGPDGTGSGSVHDSLSLEEVEELLIGEEEVPFPLQDFETFSATEDDDREEIIEVSVTGMTGECGSFFDRQDPMDQAYGGVPDHGSVASIVPEGESSGAFVAVLIASYPDETDYGAYWDEVQEVCDGEEVPGLMSVEYFEHDGFRGMEVSLLPDQGMTWASIDYGHNAVWAISMEVERDDLFGVLDAQREKLEAGL